MAKISQSIKKHVGTLQKCSGMIPKRSGNRFEQLVGSHYSIWVQNPNGFLTISCDFASDSDSDLKLDQFGVACGSLPIVSRHPDRIFHQDFFLTTSISSDSNASSILNRFHPIVFFRGVGKKKVPFFSRYDPATRSYFKGFANLRGE